MTQHDAGPGQTPGARSRPEPASTPAGPGGASSSRSHGDISVGPAREGLVFSNVHPEGSAVPPVPPVPDGRDVDALRADLEAWTVDAVHELLGPVAQAAMAREEAVPALMALRGRSEPLAVLTAAFVLGRPQPRSRLA